MISFSSRHHRWIVAAFAVLTIAISWWCYWTAPALPFRDYPSHLARVAILADANTPEFLQHYQLIYLPIPNLLGDLLAVPLAKIMPVDRAGRLLYMFYSLALPLSLFYLGLTCRRNCAFLVIFSGLLYACNHCVTGGNLNFTLSLPCAFFAIGAARRLAAGRNANLAYIASSWLLYLAHALTFAATLVIVAVCLARVWRRHIRVLFLGLFPPLLAITWLLSAYPQAVGWIPFPDFGLRLASLRDGLLPPLFSPSGRPFFLAGLTALWLWVAFRARRHVFATVLLTLAAAALLLPQWLGSLNAPGPRLLLFVTMLAPLVLPPLNARSSLIIIVGCGLLALDGRIREFQYVLTAGRQVARLVRPLTAAARTSLPPAPVMYPFVAPKYTDSPATHRVFEYFTARYGGQNPEMFVSGTDLGTTFILSARRQLSYPGHTATTINTADLRRNYNTVLIVGRERPTGMQAEDEIRRAGFRPVVLDPVIGVFAGPDNAAATAVVTVTSPAGDSSGFSGN